MTNSSRGKKSLAELCIEKGMPLTKKRKVIISVIEKDPGHLNTEDVYNRAKMADSSISIATVYRSLKLMRDFNVIDHHSFGQEHQHFESPMKSHHDHFVCNECGKIMEFTDDSLEKLKSNVAKSHDFEMHSHRLEIYGLCSDCSKTSG